MPPSISFDPPLFMQRRATVLKTLRSLESPVTSLLDLGCGPEFFLLTALTTCDDAIPLERVYGIDVDPDVKELAAKVLCGESADEIDRWRDLDYKIMFGSFEGLTKELVDGGVDVVVSCEVVEHLDPEPLKAFPEVVLGTLKPSCWIVTTPNREFNVLYELPIPDEEGNLTEKEMQSVSKIGGDGGRYWKEGVEYGMRHDDHRFEWTRNEFRNWVSQVAGRFGYDFTIIPIGTVANSLCFGDEEKERVLMKESLRRFLDAGMELDKDQLLEIAQDRFGSSSQAAVFTLRKDTSQNGFAAPEATDSTADIPTLASSADIPIAEPSVLGPNSVENITPPPTPKNTTYVLQDGDSSSTPSNSAETQPLPTNSSDETTVRSAECEQATLEDMVSTTTAPETKNDVLIESHHPVETIFTTRFSRSKDDPPYPPTPQQMAFSLATVLPYLLPENLSKFWTDPSDYVAYQFLETRTKRLETCGMDMSRIRVVKAYMGAEELWNLSDKFRRQWRYSFDAFIASLTIPTQDTTTFTEREFRGNTGPKAPNTSSEEYSTPQATSEIEEVASDDDEYLYDTDGSEIDSFTDWDDSTSEEQLQQQPDSLYLQQDDPKELDNKAAISNPSKNRKPIDWERDPLRKKITAEVSFVLAGHSISTLSKEETAEQVLILDTRKDVVGVGGDKKKEAGALMVYKLKDDYRFEGYYEGVGPLQMPGEPYQTGTWKLTDEGWCWVYDGCQECVVVDDDLV